MRKNYINNHEYAEAGIESARKLRKNMTEQERRLWYCFLKDYPVKIYRQRAIDRFIVDFYCSRALLAIELDGGEHYEETGVEYDKRRTAVLKQKGIEVLRFANPDVDRNFESVCIEIDEVIKKRIGGVEGVLK